jgi:hypothetical protein
METNNAITIILNKDGEKVFHQFFMLPKDDFEKDILKKLLEKALQDLESYI